MAMTDDELLTPRPAPNEALQAELLDRAARRVRANLWRRRAARAAVCLACFGLGWATTYLRPPSVPEVVYVPLPAPPVAEAPAPPAPPRDNPPPSRPLSPADLELLAEQTPEKAEAARRFRQAGDRYLREFADYRAALRCYRNFLDEADPADRAVAADDSWLLTSLKRAREQESTQ
jgi:hypothetical protein